MSIGSRLIFISLVQTLSLIGFVSGQCDFSNIYDETLCQQINDKYNCIPVTRQAAAMSSYTNSTTGLQQIVFSQPPNEQWWWLVNNGTEIIVMPAVKTSITCAGTIWVITDPFGYPYWMKKILFSRTEPFSQDRPAGCSSNTNYNTSICVSPYGCDMVPQSEAFTVIINQTTGNKQVNVKMPRNENWYWLLLDEYGITYTTTSYMYYLNNTFFCMNNMWYAYNQQNKYPSLVVAWALSRRKPSNTPLPPLCTIDYRSFSSGCPSCTIVPQDVAVEIVMRNTQQLRFLTTNDWVQFYDINGIKFYNLSSQSMNSRTMCNSNGYWTFSSENNDNIDFSAFIVYHSPENPCDTWRKQNGNKSKCGINSVEDGSGKECLCKCNPGYEYSNNSSTECIDVDECLLWLPCNSTLDTPFCTNTPGSYKCSCNQSDYEVVNGICQIVNKCRNINPPCDPATSTCDPKTGNCTCNQGFQKNAKNVCADINECLNNTAYNCTENSKCSNTKGSYNCVCNTGYKKNGNPFKCVDIDECKNNSTICPSNSTCENSIGDYKCNCAPPLFQYNNHDCSINTTQGCASECGNHSYCIKALNLNEVLFCFCDSGYETDHETGYCKNIDECKTTQSGCASRVGKCVDTEGSWYCECKDGFRHPAKNNQTCKKTPTSSSTTTTIKTTKKTKKPSITPATSTQPTTSTSKQETTSTTTMQSTTPTTTTQKRTPTIKTSITSTTKTTTTLTPFCPVGNHRCSPDLNYNTSLCAAVQALYPNITTCIAVEDRTTLFTIKDNGPCGAQTFTMLAEKNEDLLVALFLPNGTIFNGLFPPEYLTTEKVNCANNTWFFYSNGNKEISSLMFFTQK